MNYKGKSIVIFTPSFFNKEKGDVMEIQPYYRIIMKPLFAVLLVFGLVACSDSDTVSGGTPAPQAFSSVYVMEQTNERLRAWDSAQTVSGDVVADRVVSGPDTGITSGYGIEYDSRSQSILLGDNSTNAVVIFDNALNADGNVSPSRTIIGGSTLLNSGYDLALDEGRDLLYATTDFGLLVFSNASTADGDVSPVRVITGADVPMSADHRLALDAGNDRLYISDFANSLIMVYDNISSKTGNTAPDRVVTLSTNPWGIALDAGRDIVYVNQYAGSTIDIFDNAADMNGTVTPDRSISGGTVVFSEGADMVCDPVSDMLYLTTGNGSQVMVWHNASTVTGDTAADREISGANTGLSRPVDIVGIN